MPRIWLADVIAADLFIITGCRSCVMIFLDPALQRTKRVRADIFNINEVLRYVPTEIFQIEILNKKELN